MQSRFFVLAIVLILVCGLLFALRMWLHATLEFIPIAITSSDKTVYFFDTQVVTQHIEMDEPALITRLEVPWYPPTVDTPVTVEIRRYGKLLSRWPVLTVGDGSSAVLSLSFSTPQYIDGILDVSFSAPTIDRAHLAVAPKLFLEPLDESFPSGHYRIADEEKQGDIQMRLIGQKKRIEILKYNFTQNPMLGIGTVSSFLVGICLLAALPSVLKRSVKV